jgi:rubrerythrin
MNRDTSFTPEEILNTALAKEKAAFNHYDRMLKSTNIELIRDLLQELNNEEYEHIKLVENKIRRLNLGQGHRTL